MQDRKKRPVGTGTGDGTDTDFEQVSVPPVEELVESLKQAQSPSPCKWGCYCNACLRGDCDKHTTHILRSYYLKGERG